jgi:hypothetical protein
MTVVLGLSAAACTRKPSAEECGRAWQHVSEILEGMAIEDMNRMAADVPDDVKKRMAEDLKARWATMMEGRVRDALIEACQRQPLARARCVLDAKTVEELVKVCGMKASPGFRGGVALSWPD